MPRALSLCSYPGCHELVERGKCIEHRQQARKHAERTRPNAGERGYGAKWRRTAARFLEYHPSCECDDCLKLPEHERPKADTVDHRDGLGPLGPDGHKWANLRAMTGAHHSKRTARDQPGGWNVDGRLT